MTLMPCRLHDGERHGARSRPASAGTAAASAACLSRSSRALRRRGPEPAESGSEVRLSAVRLLRDAKYPEAIVPLAPLVIDPLDPIQLEAIAAELSFFLVRGRARRRRRRLRRRGAQPRRRARRRSISARWRVWPRPAPPELVDGAAQGGRRREPAGPAGSDLRARRRSRRRRLPADAEQLLIKALDHYDPGDPRRRGARRRRGSRCKAAADALIKAVNDSNADVRYAAMRALGALREERAVVGADRAAQVLRQGRGRVVGARRARAHRAPVERPAVHGAAADKDPFMRRAAAEGLGRAGDTVAMSALETGAGNDPSDDGARGDGVRAAEARAELRAAPGRFLTTREDALQVQDYLIELGPPIEQELLPQPAGARRDDARSVADVLGAIGGDASLPRAPGPDKDRATRRRRRRARTRAVERDQACAARCDPRRASSTRGRRSTSRAISSARSSSTRRRAGLAVRASSSKPRPTSANRDPACHAAPGPDRPQRAALRPAGHRLRLPELRHPLSGERGDRAGGSPAAVLIRALEPLDGEPLMRRRRARGTARRPEDFSAPNCAAGPAT